jgi:hypothetical protein
MKSTILSLLILLVGTASLASAHEHKIAGPNGGRLLTIVEPHAEFFVTPDRKVQITFVDDALQPIAVAAQTVIVTAGDRTAPTTLNFVREGNVLVSDRELPPGNNFPAIVQLKTSPEAKTTVARFNVNFSTCPGCNYTEYACICDH